MPDTASVVHRDPEILGGTLVFVGTRVPFRNLIDYFDLTGDQNLEFQQNISKRRLGVVVLCADSNALEDLLPPCQRR